MKTLLQLARTGVLTIAWLVVIPCLILLLSVFVPIVPWLRIYASSVVPRFAALMFLLSLEASIVGMIAHTRYSTRVTRLLVGGASAATLASAWVILHLLYFTESNNAKIDVVRALSMRPFSDGAGPDESRIYSQPDGEPLWLDIYRPRRASPTALSPVMMAVHGGGFTEGSRTFGAANMRWFADNGWTVISVDYRLARPDRPTWNLAVRDVECALAWVGANAAALKIDAGRITLTGGSAGGSLAMAAAYAGNAGRVDPGCGSPPRVAAVVVKVPLIDAAGAWRHEGEMRDEQRRYLTQYIGGSPDRYPARYAALDFRRQLWASNPPTLILGGSQDALIPPEGAAGFTRDASAAGLRVRHLVFPYSGHDFNTRFDSITNQTVLQLVRDFMVEQGAGPVPSP